MRNLTFILLATTFFGCSSKPEISWQLAQMRGLTEYEWCRQVTSVSNRIRCFLLVPKKQGMPKPEEEVEVEETGEESE